MNTSKKRYLFCEPCGFKRIIDISEPCDLTPIKTSSIPRGAPQLDVATKKTIVSKPIKARLKFKCPKCGRAITAKDVPVPVAEIIKKKEDDMVEEINQKQLEEEGFVNKALDGTNEKSNNS